MTKTSHCFPSSRCSYIMRYLNGTKDYGVLYSTSDNLKLISYSGSDWARIVDEREHIRAFLSFGIRSHIMGFQEVANSLIINNRS